MRKTFGLILAILLLFAPGVTEEKKVSFDAKAAWNYINDLASDSMQGRKSGQPGATIAEKYIAHRLKKWGVEPAGENGTYFQNFTIEHSNVAEGVRLEIISEKERRSFHYGEDWNVWGYSGSGHFTAEIIFTGYGIHAPQKKYDDYAGVEVKGKLVLFSSGTPPKLVKELEEEAKIQNRIKAAQELGARGVLVFRGEERWMRYHRGKMGKEIYKPEFVILHPKDNINAFIFRDLKTELRYLFREIDKTSKPMSFATGVKAFISVNSIFDERRPTRNVLAKISGTDNILKNEYIVVGAHLDHLGIDPFGNVMNGADDNASGTAAIMEIARIMKLNKAKPRRTVVFAFWAGEEQGLLGSRYYADHPLFPIEKTLININLDMVGQGKKKVYFMGVYYAPEIWEILKKKLPKEILSYIIAGRGGPGGSDHTPFLTKGVPAYFVHTESPHFKYHTSRDDIDLIKPALLKKTGDFVHEAIEILASYPGHFIQPLRQELYQMRVQNLINFKLDPLVETVNFHKDVKDSHVDLQLAAIENKEGLYGGELLIDTLNNLLSFKEQIKKVKGLSLYSSSPNLWRVTRQGKTTILPGLKGLDVLREKPRWAEVLAELGIYYVIEELPSFLFIEEGLSEMGKKIIEAMNKNGLLLGIKGLNAFQAKTLLENSRKPVILLAKELPEKGVMELIKEKKSALGLILSKGEDAGSYFENLDRAKKTLGSGSLMIVNEECMWKAGKDQMIEVISEVLKAKYERTDINNLVSATFLRVLTETRSQEPSPGFPSRPF